jgi:uncharacterized protein YyaL (SSP411 family)
MARAAIALVEAGAGESYLDAARALVESLDAHFIDAEGGGYFFTASDAADVIVRRKDAHDNATPSGNGIMVGVLARLWSLAGEARYRDKAERLTTAFGGEVERNFFPLMTLMNNAELLEDMVEIVIVGAPDDPGARALHAAVHARCLPNKVLRRLAPGAPLPPQHPAHGKGLVDGKATAYVCRNMACSAPVTTAEALAGLLA